MFFGSRCHHATATPVMNSPFPSTEGSWAEAEKRAGPVLKENQRADYVKRRDIASLR